MPALAGSADHPDRGGAPGRKHLTQGPSHRPPPPGERRRFGHTVRWRCAVGAPPAAAETSPLPGPARNGAPDPCPQPGYPSSFVIAPKWVLLRKLLRYKEM